MPQQHAEGQSWAGGPQALPVSKGERDGQSRLQQDSHPPAKAFKASALDSASMPFSEITMLGADDKTYPSSGPQAESAAVLPLVSDTMTAEVMHLFWANFEVHARHA